MAIVYATTSGNWADAATWGGHSMTANDIGAIPIGKTVVYNNGSQCLGFQILGGTLYLTGDMPITDAPSPASYGAHITFHSTAGGKLIGNNAGGNWLIRSVSANPTNPIKTVIYSIAGPETRTFSLDYYALKGILPYFGNDEIVVNCNDPANANSPVIESVTPMMRETSILEHVILGRSHGRIHRKGEHSGTCVVSGHCPWDSNFPTKVNQLMATGKRFSVIWNRVMMPFCRFEGTPKFTPKPGTLDMDFSITVVEDW